MLASSVFRYTPAVAFKHPRQAQCFCLCLSHPLRHWRAPAIGAFLPGRGLKPLSGRLSKNSIQA